MKLIKKNNKKGFTLIELVIVIAILAILALILVPAIGKYIGNANDAKNQASARTIYTNAVLAHSMEPELDEGALATEVKTLSNVKAEDVVIVTVDDETNEVTEISYTTGGKKITFNGSVFVSEDVAESSDSEDPAQ